MRGTDIFEEIFLQYVNSLRDAVSDSDAESRSIEAFTRYFEILSSSLAGAEDNLLAAYEEYADVLQRAFDGDPVRKQVDDAFTTYVCNLAKAWSGSDPKLVGPAALGAIAESMLSVARIATAGDSSGDGAHAADVTQAGTTAAGDASERFADWPTEAWIVE